MTRLIAILCLFAVFAMPADAEERAMRGVALVIGQSDYENLPDLPNPANDARAIEELLEELGFEVDGTTDRDAKKLRRDLERFAEDAEDADAAIIYYSGHGIEAGGDNWLVPIDADLSALDDVGSNLVALSGVLDELRAKVPLTIFLIDACRSNPFPPGAIARNSGEQLAVSGSGLGVPRGFATVEPGATDQIGTIIGFAAEPGLPALDGDPGGNSPYAAALIRHLSAMTGNEFGLVMRMVTEEVYLKTQTQQRPWVNESLRKQLFFGTPEKLPEGTDGVITGERRKLLLTISALPGAQRTQVEKIATANGVPLDTLYGILAALGETDMPKDQASLEQALKGQASRIKSIIDERKALASDDPAITRLVAAADKAIAEGAIKSARGFLDEAKQAVEKSRGAIENVEAQARAKRISNAEILSKSAETAEIDFDFPAAAKDYAAAFDWVKDTDRTLASTYKSHEAYTWEMIGAYRGDNDSLKKAVATYEVALSFAPRAESPAQWAKVTNNLGNAYLRIGDRELVNTALEKAAALYRDALSVTQEANKEATTLSNLGIALHSLAERKNDGALYAEAEKTFAAALAKRDRKTDAVGYAMDLLNAANLDLGLADRNGEPARLVIAEQRIAEALKNVDPVVNRLEYAQGRNNLAITLRLQGANSRDSAKLREALKIYAELLPVFERKTFPLDWSNVVGNTAIAHTNLGALEGNTAEFETALGFYRQALEEVTLERSPAFWAKLQNSYGMTLQAIGLMNSDPPKVEQAAEAFRNALKVRSKEINAAQWAESQKLLASALSSMASSKTDTRLSDEAIAAYRSAREVFTRDAFPSDWMSVSSGLATALQGKGILTQNDSFMKEAEIIYREVLAATDRAKAPLDWASAMKDIATIQFMLGTTHMNKAEVEESLRSFDMALEEYSKHGGFMDKMMIGAMRNNAAQALELFQ